ncbi:MAG: hypothetical protein HN580_29980 [Deltaproteobacteria bacterium]|jgi:hypothetical protein|nr:hypothetical protein [Deltaproteobacteria bacterium]MBT4264119.1 hypothetical protein [Deltaproteobacteria bacterium]MBT4640786.1 hypothetical protein [Deltaproteobacteria bacterium]MBT6501333.1 hypothetical protein [Deltaproteobacteria bacterium]MBT6612530.1 hypothetical protein [Deltaproteobacteria bacterium]
MKNRPLKIILLVLLVFGCSTVQVFGLSFKDQLRPVKQLKYKHWHLQKKKITGYTKIEIKTTSKAGKKYFLEINQNLDKDEKVFSEKKTWFDYQTGELASYSEVDFRTGVSISDQVTETEIITQVRKKDDLLELSIQREEQLVPFETLALFLQKFMPELVKKRTLTFTLYLPVIAIELKKNNFPLSFSKFEMVARIVEESKKETPLGLKSSMQILLKPTSFLINTMLPKEKTAFHFTFMTEPPYLLLAFEENQTRSILVTYDP